MAEPFDLLITVACSPEEWPTVLRQLQQHRPSTLDDSDGGETPAALLVGVQDDWDGDIPFFPLIPEGMRVAFWSSPEGGGINFEEASKLDRLWPEGARAPGYDEAERLDRFLGEPIVHKTLEEARRAVAERRAGRVRRRKEKTDG